MIEPKSLIYSKLTEIPDIKVYQIRPEVLDVGDLMDNGVVTFFVSLNVPEYDLSKEIGKQDIEITVDIWGRTSKITGEIMKLVVSKMLEIDYLCTHNMEIPDPESTQFSHLNLRFTY